MIVVTTHSPYVLSVINVLLAAAIVKEKGLEQDVVDTDYILPSNAFSGYYINENHHRSMPTRESTIAPNCRILLTNTG